MTGIVIPDGGNIGSTSDTDAISISSSGAVTFSQDINPNNFVGMIAPFAMATPPTGWLACDGSAVSKTTYSELFTALGANAWGTDTTDNFYLPDLRGAFLRGTGSNGTVDMANGNDFAGPSVGSFEKDQFQGHLFGDVSSSYTSSATNAPLKIRDGNKRNQTVQTQADNNHGAVDVQAGSYSDALIPIDDQTNGAPRTGDETRPFNYGVNYCIKY